VATGEAGDSFGLLESRDPVLLATSEPRVFMGGGLGGGTVMEAMAEGVEASKVIEAFLYTGKAIRQTTPYDKESCGRYLDHRDAERAPLVQPSGVEGYSEEEPGPKPSAACSATATTAWPPARCSSVPQRPKKLAVEVYTDMGVNPPLSSRTATREVYSCNICGHCASVCAEDVDTGALMQFPARPGARPAWRLPPCTTTGCARWTSPRRRRRSLRRRGARHPASTPSIRAAS